MFATYMKDGHVLALPSMPDVYDGPTYPTFIQQLDIRPAYIDIVAMEKSEGKKCSIRISILNRHPSLEWTFAPSFAGFTPNKVSVTEVYSDDLAAANTWDKPEVVVPVTKEGAVDGKWEGCVVRKASWSFVVIEGERE